MERTLDQAILGLLERHAIGDQDAFLHLLARQGHEVNQSTLSRHLKKLGVHKHDGVYRRAEPASPALPTFRLTAAPPNLLILRTEPGFANALALRLDAARLPDLAGTVAGDDTVFIAVTSPERLASARVAVERFLSA